MVLIIGLGVTGLMIYQRAARIPEWYVKAQTIRDDPDVEKRTAIKLQSWANKVSSGNPATKSAEDRQLTVVLTADDINRLIVKWSQSAGLDEKLGQYIRDIRVRLTDGAITIAGKYVEYEKVVSVTFRPQTDPSGYIRIKLDSMRVGEQTLPLVVLNDQQVRLTGNVARQARSALPRLGIDEHSVATRATSDLYYTSLAADLFAGRTPQAYAFIGRLSGFSSEDPLVTRVRSMQIREGEMTLKLETLDDAERESFLNKLRSVANNSPLLP
ncbi:MAG: hypothetical protein KatS3mg104_1498 [Phycisphaerae bacterium]|nr:MAG: hypothetical protein KatS3mg104_1498 [Phycisphaerae bacterium]